MKLFLGVEKNQFEICNFWSNVERIMQLSNAPYMIIYMFFLFSRIQNFDFIINHTSFECFACLKKTILKFVIFGLDASEKCNRVTLVI